MAVGEYVSVFTAIVIGLAVTDLAISLHRLTRAGPRVRWDWITPALAVVMLLNVVAVWWASYRWYSGVSDLTIGAFLPDVVILLLVFLAVAVVLPDEVPAEGLDLRAYYWATARQFWLLNVGYLLMITGFVSPRYTAGGDWGVILTANIDNMVLLAACLTLAFVRPPWLHMAAVPMLLIGTAISYLPEGFRPG